MTDMFLGLASFAFFCLIGASVFTMIVTYKFNELCERELWQEEEKPRGVTADEGWIEVTPKGIDLSKLKIRRADIFQVNTWSDGQVSIEILDKDYKKGHRRKFYFVEVEEDYATICARLEKKE